MSASVPRGIVVELSRWEALQAAFVGCLRQTENLFRTGAKDAYGFKPSALGWGIHIEGAAGEMAVAKSCDRYWNGNLGDLSADDVGRAQVRTAAEHSHCLIVHKEDRDDRAYVLVTGLSPHFIVKGWLLGRDCKREEWWKDPGRNGRAAYFVPQSALKLPAKREVTK